MDFYTTILGSGASLPAHGRHCSGQSVNVRGFYILLDCGENTQTELRIRHQRIQTIPLVCITHLHGDHFFGLPGLLSTMHLIGRRTPIDIVAPKGIEKALMPMFEMSATNIDFELRFTELDGDGLRQVYDCDHCTVWAFPLIHTVPTYGYIIREKPRSATAPSPTYAYCTDTLYTETILPYIQGVDLLCLESTFADDLAAFAAEKQHCTAAQAAQLAAMAGVKRLLLTHFSARYKDIDLLVEQARAIFPNTIPAIEGERVPVLQHVV